MMETPIAFMGDNIEQVTKAVCLLKELISPIKCCSDFRPYMSLYDRDMALYIEDKNLKFLNSPTIGIINPICYKYF